MTINKDIILSIYNTSFFVMDVIYFWMIKNESKNNIILHFVDIDATYQNTTITHPNDD